MSDLFGPEEGKGERYVPLADRLRPETFREFFGQEDLTGQGRLLRRLVEGDRIPSMILWGPPGCGKTTLGNIIAEKTGARFVFFSAVLSGKAEVREAVAAAERALAAGGRRTILFVDEIHRFNKAQQDAFLPHVERGTITLIGATTENPSFEVISALLSRCRVFVLKALGEEALEKILGRALEDREGWLAGRTVSVEPDAGRALIRSSDGDARRMLNLLEAIVAGGAAEALTISTADVLEALQRKTLAYDKAGDEHYDLISALHKSLRGSDPDASLYWLGRMLEGGEAPLRIARRLVRFASEDVGLADPQALVQAVAAKDAVHFIGMPEGALALAQVVVYLAAAPKSNSLCEAYGRVREDIRRVPAEGPPLAIRNAPTELMARLGYGEGYRYPHDYVEQVVAQEYLPEALRGTVYYRPGQAGFEREIEKRLKYWERLKRAGGGRRKDDA